jgi:hypothetical protein
VLALLLSADAALAKGKKKPPPVAPKDEAAPVITHVPVTSHAGAAVHLTAIITDESGVFEPTLVVRKPGAPYARVAMTKEEPAPPAPTSADASAPPADASAPAPDASAPAPDASAPEPAAPPAAAGAGDTYGADVPAELLTGDVEYFIEAFDTNGNGPARAGDETAPFVITFKNPVVVAAADPAKPPEPVEEEGGGGGLLVAVGVVAGVVVLLGAGAGVAFLVYSTREKTPDTTRVSVTGPTPIAGVAP